jgi:hypothetical protein
MHRWLILIVAAIVALLAVNWRIEYATQKRTDDLKGQLQQLAPVGHARAEVERAFDARGLEHVFGPSDNIIYGRKNVGRYRLLYTTEVDYKIRLDNQGRVAHVEVIVFNEGL